MSQPPSKHIHVLVVDDEPLARQRLVDLLRTDSQVDGILEAGDGIVAVEMIQDKRPDVVFLDVQMPELDGFGVIQTVGHEQMPFTVFVTAYDQHAIRAFEANALDYLLKPFGDERYEATMTRVKSRLEDHVERVFGRQLLQMVSKAGVLQGRWDRVVVKTGGTTHFVRIADVDWIEGAGVYVNLHIAGKELLHRSTLHDFAEKLDPMCFVRIHRSTIVNIDSILQLEPISHGDFEVVMKNGPRLRVSRSYRAELEKRLGQAL